MARTLVKQMANMNSSNLQGNQGFTHLLNTRKAIQQKLTESHRLESEMTLPTQVFEFETVCSNGVCAITWRPKRSAA